MFKIRKRASQQVDENAVAVVRTNSFCKEEVFGHVQQNISTIASMFLSLLHCAFDLLKIVKRVDHGGEYGLKIPANFHSYGPGKVIKPQDQKKLKKTVKHCLKEHVHKPKRNPL